MNATRAQIAAHIKGPRHRQDSERIIYLRSESRADADSDYIRLGAQIRVTSSTASVIRVAQSGWRSCAPLRTTRFSSIASVLTLDSLLGISAFMIPNLFRDRITEQSDKGDWPNNGRLGS